MEVGANFTLTVQDAAGASDTPTQASAEIRNWVAFRPLSEAADNDPDATPPAFLTVKTTAPDVAPTEAVKKSCDGGLIVNGEIPVPDSPAETDPPALLTSKLAVFAPNEVGANFTLTVQDAAGASDTPTQASAEIRNWVAFRPLNEAADNDPDATPPAFLTVKTTAAEVEVEDTFEKSCDGGLIPSVTTTPVPDRAAEADPAALLTSKLAILAPIEVGANFTLTVHDAAGARFAPTQVSAEIVN